MNTDIWNAIVNATKETFSKMTTIELTQVEENPGDFQFDVSGLMGFSGEVVGNVALSLSVKTAHAAVSRLIAEENLSEEEILDGVAEFVNTIVGNAQTGFQSQEFTLSLPEIVTGKGHRLDFRRYSEKMQILFDSPEGHILVSLAYRNRN